MDWANELDGTFTRAKVGSESNTMGLYFGALEIFTRYAFWRIRQT